MSSGLKSEASLHSLHRSIVTIYVSPEQYPFYFHKGRLYQYSYFKKAFHGPFKEATTNVIYLKEDGVNKFKLFEEWLYSGKLSCPKEPEERSLLLVKVFCFAEKVGISKLQNATLDTIRDTATVRQISPLSPGTMHNAARTPHNPFVSDPISTFQFQTHQSTRGGPTLKKSLPKYLPPATSSAISYAYQNTLERSPVRKLLADIFAYNVNPETLNEDILSFPAQFMADVLLINMKRLPLRLKGEEAAFDQNADKYHVRDSSSTPNDRKQRTLEDVEVRGAESDFDSRNAPTAEAAETAIPEPELSTEATSVDEDDRKGFGGPAGPSSGKAKKKGMKS